MVTVADLLVAAIDTTSNSLSFAILYMIKYPEVQRRVQAELDGVLVGTRPTVFDRPNLPYTEATMWEVLRISNVLPVLVRTSSYDTNVGGYAVKEVTCHFINLIQILQGSFKQGVFGVLNIYKMHMNPVIWGDPHNFRPERFLDSNGKVIRDHGVMAFGGR